MELSGDDRIRFEVATANGRDDIQVDMPDGPMLVLSYEDVGITREIVQHQGISSLLGSLIEKESNLRI